MVGPRSPARSIHRSRGQAALARLSTAEPAPEHGERALADLLGPFRPRGRAETAVTGTLDIPTFTDDAERRGLAFTFDNGHSEQYQLPETFGGGVAVLDFDGDGWLDVYAVGGGPFPPPQGPACFGDRLFRNRGDGQFDDVTSRSGLGELRAATGSGSPWATLTTTATPTFSSRDGGAMPFITTWATAASRKSPRAPAWAATGIGPRRQPGPTWTTMAIWTSMSATT